MNHCRKSFIFIFPYLLFTFFFSNYRLLHFSLKRKTFTMLFLWSAEVKGKHKYESISSQILKLLWDYLLYFISYIPLLLPLEYITIKNLSFENVRWYRYYYFEHSCAYTLNSLTACKKGQAQSIISALSVMIVIGKFKHINLHCS